MACFYVLSFILSAGPALYFFRKAATSRRRSSRLANWALVCGLTMFVVPEAFGGGGNISPTDLFSIGGTIRIAVGILGTALAIAAFRYRRDGGTGVARVVVGIVFNILHILSGASMLIYSDRLEADDSWNYESPDGLFRLKLPSHHWQPQPKTPEGATIEFVHDWPDQKATVRVYAGIDAEWKFARMVELYKVHIKEALNTLGRPGTEEGTNAAGNRYSYYSILNASRDEGAVFFGHSFIWLPAKKIVVEVVYQAPLRKAFVQLVTCGTFSDAERSIELESFRQTARAICLSVEQSNGGRAEDRNRR